MLQSLFIICGCIFGVKTTEVSDGKYVLTSSGSAEFVSSFEDLKTKCKNSWPLEIYDENVVALLKQLNVDTQQHGILLGMKRGTNAWMWSDGSTYSSQISGSINDQVDATRVMACVALDNNIKAAYFARTIFDSAYVLCSKVLNVDKCSGWFNNGLCYFKPISTTFKWFEAHNECIQNEASMPMFTNSEPNFNSSFFDNKCYWVSLSRNTWNWTHADEAVTFNKWFYGQPDNSGTLNCATTNSAGNDWKSVVCSGTYHVVCMRGVYQSVQPTTSTSTLFSISNPSDATKTTTTTHSIIPKPGITIITTTSKEPSVEGSLSEGAKAGIGVGVCLLFIIIITIAAILIFKYLPQIKNAFKRSNKRNPLPPEDHLTTYSTPVVKNPRNTISPGIGLNTLEYADLDFEKQFD